MLRDVILADTGPSPRCAQSRTNAEAIACARRAFERREPFALCDSGWGMDSFIENAVAGLPNGNVAVYVYDSMGPETRGVCLRPNVSFAADDWPRCKTALVDVRNLRTNQPPVEPILPNDEPWPRSCAAAARVAAQDGVRIHLIAGRNVLPDYERWGVRCRDAVSFEMLIARDGSVSCVRVRSVGSRPRNPALYDAIRSRLMRWRFDPPMVHDEPVAARWSMQLNAIRNGDRPLPGPPIYPICP